MNGPCDAISTGGNGIRLSRLLTTISSVLRSIGMYSLYNYIVAGNPFLGMALSAAAELSLPLKDAEAGQRIYLSRNAGPFRFILKETRSNRNLFHNGDGNWDSLNVACSEHVLDPFPTTGYGLSDEFHSIDNFAFERRAQGLSTRGRMNERINSTMIFYV